MSTEPESLILELLRQMRAELPFKADLGELATKGELVSLRSELKSDMRTLRADVASDLLSSRKELSEQIVGLRRAVIEYHTSVVGHRVPFNELEQECAGSNSISTYLPSKRAEPPKA